MTDEKEWVGGVAPLTSRSQVKKSLGRDPEISRTTKKTLLALWGDGLIHVFPNQTVSLTEEGAVVGKEIQENDVSSGYSPEVLAFLKSAFESMRRGKKVEK